jgi:replication-associated recombination protein RarA
MAIGNMKTLSGYRFDEVFSALQKTIRRGEEREAMYWAIELEKEFAPHLWNRLEIIAHEDIGIADMHCLLFVRMCKEQYFEIRKRKSGSTRLVLSNAILAMARAEKCRLADEFNIVSYRYNPQYAIPDVARDKHTSAGRRMGRGVGHFLDEGVMINNAWDGYDGEYYDEHRRLLEADAPIRYKHESKTPAPMDEVNYDEPVQPGF